MPLKQRSTILGEPIDPDDWEWDDENIFEHDSNLDLSDSRQDEIPDEPRLTIDTVYEILDIPDWRIMDRDITVTDTREDNLDRLWEIQFAEAAAAAQATSGPRC